MQLLWKDIQVKTIISRAQFKIPQIEKNNSYSFCEKLSGWEDIFDGTSFLQGKGTPEEAQSIISFQISMKYIFLNIDPRAPQKINEMGHFPFE